MQIELHVVPVGQGRALRWSLELNGRLLGPRFRRQDLVIRRGRTLARKHHFELVTHRPNGEIRAKDSHGYDSPRRKG